MIAVHPFGDLIVSSDNHDPIRYLMKNSHGAAGGPVSLAYAASDHNTRQGAEQMRDVRSRFAGQFARCRAMKIVWGA